MALMGRSSQSFSLMRIWLLVPLCVLCIAGAVLFSSETQRATSAITYKEAETAQGLFSTFLDQNRDLRRFLETGHQSALERYLTEGRRMEAHLRRADVISADDPAEMATIARQRSAYRRWQALAREELAAAQGSSRRARTDNSLGRDRLIDDFTVANRDYQARLAALRDVEESAAALVAVWLTLLVSGLFTAVGGVLLVRSRRRDRRLQEQRAAQRTTEDAFRSSQARFGEALQVSESQAEAHRLLTRHLEATIPESSAVALNRNNSADRLEPTVPLDRDSVLWEPLQQAKPRSCLAVRLNRPYERGESSEEILECEICGALPAASICEPLLVGGEVIGSVLVSVQSPPTGTDRRRIDGSVSQAAPVLANLRNLALAETRAATDALTGLPNKRALDDSLKQMAAQSGRTGSPLSAIFLDLDHFKRINDTHGHDRGDEVLAAVGAVLRTELRASDLPGRMGGEEFLILAPDTDRPGALELAEKVRQAMHGIQVRDVERGVTASFGVATLPYDAVDVDTLMRIADRALYSAKQNGRDRVEAPAAEVGEPAGAGAAGDTVAEVQPLHSRRDREPPA
jgi:diguanylate cyclase (GGDEF)-like protein